MRESGKGTTKEPALQTVKLMSLFPAIPDPE